MEREEGCNTLAGFWYKAVEQYLKPWFKLA